MFERVTLSRFMQRFEERNRGDNFSYGGLKVLFNYLNDLESDTGEEYELDVIGICCDFSEYESIKDYNNQNGTEYSTPEELSEDTVVLMIDEYRFVALVQ